MRRLLLNSPCIEFSRDPLLSLVYNKRPDTTTCLMHPYFWDSGQRLGFLQDASDRFEIMCRDPRDPHLVMLENNAIDVVGPDWAARLDRIFVENLGKFRKYDGRSVQDLLRALRNKVRYVAPHPPFFSLSPTSHAADSPVCVPSLRNTITKTYPKVSGATSAPCQKDTSRTLHAVTLDCSSTCTLSSPTHLSAKSPCFGRTLILMIDHPITHCLFIPSLHPSKNVLLLMYMYICIYLFSAICLSRWLLKLLLYSSLDVIGHTYVR